MSTIAIASRPYQGHWIPLVKLGRNLEALGHRVVYLGTSEHFETARYRERIEFIDIRTLGDSPAPETWERFARQPGSELASVDNLRKYFRLWADCQLEKLGASVLAVDAALAIGALAGHKHGCRVVMVHTCLPYTREDGLPPLTTALTPASPPEAVQRAWAWADLGRALQNLADVGLTDQLLKEFALECGYQGPIEVSGPAAFGLGFAEVVLCPRCFDFPHDTARQRVYGEPSLDLDDDGGSFPFSWLDPERRLIYCAVGSLSPYPAPVLRMLFQSVFRWIDERSDWQAVIAAGGGFDPALLDTQSDRVLVVERAPQIRLLERASLFVTHGGNNSVREALYFGVPMVVTPLHSDQPGNAARVQYHGLGVMVPRGQQTEADATAAVITAIKTVADDPAYARRANDMARQFRELEARAPAAAFIGELASRG